MKCLTASFFSLFALAGVLAASPVTVTADLVNGGSPALHDTNGDLVGPYTLNINGVNYAALCIDFNDTATIGEHYSAYESTVGGDISHTYHPTFTKQYEEEAYLMSLILQPGADRIDIQHAAWAITDSSYHVNLAAQTYLDEAKSNYWKIDYSKFTIVSDASSRSRGQEFLIDPNPTSATPEPASILLMGGGLLAAGLFRRKSMKKA